MSAPDESRIGQLERRVNLLTGLVVVQALLLSGVFPYVTLGFLLLLPILSFMHQRLPRWAHWFGRMTSRFFSR